MIETPLWLLAAFALAFLINLVPAFMPSTWVILSFFYIRFGLPLLLLSAGGTLASAAGRFYLARASSWFRRRVLSDRPTEIDELGGLLNQHQHLVAPIVFLYALTPLPTNNLFIAGGMANVSMAAMLTGFIAARLIANTLLIWTTSLIVTDLGALFQGAYSPRGIALQIAGALSVVVFYKLPWAKWLRRATSNNGGGAARP